jgi:hypothetical protein
MRAKFVHYAYRVCKGYVWLVRGGWKKPMDDWFRQLLDSLKEVPALAGAWVIYCVVSFILLCCGAIAAAAPGADVYIFLTIFAIFTVVMSAFCGLVLIDAIIKKFVYKIDNAKRVMSGEKEEEPEALRWMAPSASQSTLPVGWRGGAWQPYGSYSSYSSSYINQHQQGLGGGSNIPNPGRSGNNK